MSDVPTNPIILYGTVLASVVAGTVSLVGLIISKEQKVSEFRQAWIDALREDVAALIAHANSMQGSYKVYRDNVKENWKDIQLSLFGMNNATGKIRLRLNPSEKDSHNVLKQIEKMEYLFTGTVPEATTFNACEKELVSLVNIILKKEWKRVKSGDTFFKSLKFLLLTSIVFAVATICIYSIFRGK